MRAICATVLLAAITFLGSQTPVGAEALTRVIDEDIQRLEWWRYSSMKYLDLVQIRLWDCVGAREDVLLRLLRSEMLERRCTVTRLRDAELPTWDGSTAAFIFDPAIWYFDPDRCRVADDSKDLARIDVMPPLHFTGPGFSLQARSEPERYPGSFDKREEMYRDEAHQASALAQIQRTAAVRDFDAAMMDLQLGFICSSPANPADVRSILDSPKSQNQSSWGLYISSYMPSERQLSAITNAFARRRRLIAESPAFMFAPWIARVDPGSTVFSEMVLACRNPMDEIPPAAAPSDEVSDRHTLLDFMLENPGFTLPIERPRARGLFR